MTGRSAGTVAQAAVTAGVAIGVGILHAPLLPALLVALPISWAVVRLGAAPLKVPPGADRPPPP